MRGELWERGGRWVKETCLVAAGAVSPSLEVVAFLDGVVGAAGSVTRHCGGMCMGCVGVSSEVLRVFVTEMKQFDTRGDCM